MKDFCEAVLTIEVNSNLAGVYKKAIESENTDTRWNRNTVIDSNGNIVTNDLEPVWNGVYAYVEIGEVNHTYDDVPLTIQLLSHTAKSLKQVVEWYERVGCKVIYQNYREETK